MSPEPPPVRQLTKAQYDGWACCWCGKSLLDCGGTSVGVSRGQQGAVVLDIEVYACPSCAVAPRVKTRQEHR